MAQAFESSDILIGCDAVFSREAGIVLQSVARMVGSSAPERGDAVVFDWPLACPRIRASFHLFTAPGSAYAPDLSYAVGLHDWIDQETQYFRRFDGLVILINPLYGGSAMSRVAKRLRVLRESLEAFGRPHMTFPVVFVVVASEAEAHTRYPTAAIRDQIWWPDAAFFDVDSVSGKGLDLAVDHLLLSVLNVRGLKSAPLEPLIPEEPATTSVALPAFDMRQTIQHLERAEHRQVLEALLSVWRASRASEVAEIIEAASYAARRMRPVHGDHDWWVRTCRARDPLDLPVLIDSLTSWDDGPELHEHVDQVVERLSGLRWWQDDPRIPRRLGSLLVDMTPYRKVPVQRGIASALLAQRDPRSIHLVRRYLSDLGMLRPPHTYRRPDLVYVFGEGGVDAKDFSVEQQVELRATIHTEHQDAWNDLCERIRRPLPRPEDMEAIAANPHDDALRRELAIRMQERGDPRGEFILLQLRKAAGDSLSPEEHEREQALKRTYAWDWLGPLADVVDVENSVFERGYPVKVTVWTPNTRAIRDVIGRPEWATIRELRWGGDPCWEEDEADPALVNHPVMRSLQIVTTKMPEDPAELEALRRVAWAR